MIAEKTFDQITVGDKAQFEAVIDDSLVQTFSDFSGDHNSLHTDAVYAETTPLGACVAHGMLGGAFFSRLVGMYLPGKYCLYLSQSLSFRKPVRIGTKVVVSGTVIQKVDAFHTLRIVTEIRDLQTDDLFTDGEAVVRVLL